MLKQLFKYPGGKYDEYKRFSHLIPQTINDYYEPFAGSCGVYLRLKNDNKISGISYINDFSMDLVNFFKEVASGLVVDELIKIENCLTEIKGISKRMVAIYSNSVFEAINGGDTSFIENLCNDAKSEIDKNEEIKKLNLGENDLSEIVGRQIRDKIKRFSKKEITANTETIAERCIATAIHQGFYFAVRNCYNEWLVDKTCSKYMASEKAAQWFFIREMCYGSMFRFGKNGNFNIPYGGYDYNKKSMSEKISIISAKETKEAFSNNIVIENGDFSILFNREFNKDDFIFLDPPYDSTFTDYDGNGFTKDDHRRLAESLKSCNCKWLMIIGKTDFISDLYKGYNIVEYDKTYMYQARGKYDGKHTTHLAIANYPIEDFTIFGSQNNKSDS